MMSHTLLQILRRRFFWKIDKFKGSKVKAHLENIARIQSNLASAEVEYERKRIIESLLNHAVCNSEFYKPFKGFSNLKDFPIITKMDIKERYSDFFARNYLDKFFVEIATSGSTGIPFIVRQDRNKKNRNTADTIYFGKLGGYQVGDHLYYIRKWTEDLKRSKLGLFFTNIEEIEVTKLSSMMFEKLVPKMARDRSRKALLGYASGMAELARHMDKTNQSPMKHKFNSVIAISEGISNNIKTKLEYFLGSPVISRYSNSENGIIAQQFVNTGNDYHINWASYEVEVLELLEDKPAEPGQIGRIVITDLFNYYMPIIRYDTGDLGVMDLDTNGLHNFPLLKSIEGRKMDVIYNTRGKIVSSFLALEIEVYQELKQFQLIQDDKKEYTVKLNIDGQFEHEVELTKKLQKHLGEDAHIKYAYENNFPVLASGKQRWTINNYTNEK